MSYEIEETEKELKLKEIKKKLADKYTPDVFRDSLEGRTISMDSRTSQLMKQYKKPNIQKQQQYQEMSP